MEKIKVLLTSAVARPEDLQAIRAIDPRIDVVHAVYVDHVIGRMIEAQRARGGPPLTFDESTFYREIGAAEVIYGLGLPSNITEQAPRLKWVQVSGAGFDYLRPTGILEKGITLTNNGGANAYVVAEFCLALMLMHAKQMPAMVQNQRQRKWINMGAEDLRRHTLGVVGTGHIGLAVAQRASGFDMTILGTRRSYTPGQTLPYIHEMFSRDRLHEMLARCDHVVVTVDLNAETRHMISDAEFKAMKRGAFFVNVSRGPVVEEPALVRALQSGHLGGAGLDVFEKEPLPQSSPLWDMPNVIVLPHNSGSSRNLRTVEAFIDNLRRYVRGEPLQNVITPSRGY